MEKLISQILGLWSYNHWWVGLHESVGGARAIGGLGGDTLICVLSGAAAVLFWRYIAMHSSWRCCFTYQYCTTAVELVQFAASLPCIN
jgi:hypothetical protein